MGAGARLAEERGRWADHWRIIDLDHESEHLLDSLDPGEELRAAVPGRLRMSGPRVVDPVLIGVTDRRVLVVGPSMPGGMVELDLDPMAWARLREHADELGARPAPAELGGSPAPAWPTGGVGGGRAAC